MNTVILKNGRKAYQVTRIRIFDSPVQSVFGSPVAACAYTDLGEIPIPAGALQPQLGDYYQPSERAGEMGMFMTAGEVALDYAERALSMSERFAAAAADYAAFMDEQAKIHAAGCASHTMDFGDALKALKNGKRIARAGWNGKGMWLCLGQGHAGLEAEKFWNPHTRAFAEQNGGTAPVLPYIIMKTAAGEILMGWLASQTDMLAEDWQIL
jgi:hypothetical protein